MKSVVVLGNGQLGSMLHQAGEQLGISVFPISVDTTKPVESILFHNSVITAEIERWPDNEITRKLANNNNFINIKLFNILSDRLKQKKLLNKLNLATAPWKQLHNIKQLQDILVLFNYFAIVKCRLGGYDGRGQWQFRSGEKIILPLECYGQCIVEKGIDFDEEISILGARSTNGTIVFYPLTKNFHQNGILRVCVVFPYQYNTLQKNAEKMLGLILNKLNYVGVMAMECFLIGNNLLINELAPRVHNSGHWTQNGASISQFELHLRAIINLPLPTPIITAPSVMINIIGTDINNNWLYDPLVNLHWYDKKVRPGRKVGHINICHPDHDRLNKSLQYLQQHLPVEYKLGIDWAIKQLG
ncbi:5-(carboxyamino)imidazole ribonucleotide synthase [Candidatus Palibaumannia cicadellinicola]|uniref:N5-carboxyaminoimidazole ribonucleotide synthase n=1 Tax=Candidatus Palibaumannia cicadellinicola TaxID=186490 RepID=A0A0K2BKZ3_9GAMM|nr:5-(carboxyamino)imidazole ribonucleotide synthase [Candidatus Baumannia cicadellinicola]AKZ65718.1 Phosphoribosylaminoimidazole carboxylase ATPase subunit [Candidatus Baumannia cicadellinicola]